MEAVIATVLALVLMLAALIVLARSWPGSSKRTGYRVWMRDRSRDSLTEAQERGDVIREDDDSHWRWDPPEQAGGSGTDAGTAVDAGVDDADARS